MNSINTSSITLTSLVLLKQHIDSVRDYYDYLVPFIEQIYIEAPDDSYDAGEIQVFMESDFGLIIPQEVVSFVLLRMKKKGYLSATDNKFSKGPKFKGQDFNPQKVEATSKIEEVITGLQKFAKTVGRDELSNQQAMEAIQRFLSRFQIECIETSTHGTALPNLQHIETWDEGLIGLFPEEILKNNIGLFESFMVLVQGNMLANALISTDIRTPPTTFRKTTFYFDTPNILNALGYSGEEKQKLANELIVLLKRLNGRIAVFEHSIEEAKNIINTTANNIENPFYAQKPLNLVAIKEKWRKSDLLLKAEKISEDCEKLGFTIKPTPAYYERYQIDEQNLQDVLQSNNVNNFEGQSSALEYDIKSIRSIYVLRRDKVPTRLEDTNAILITNNYAFAYASFIYAKSHNIRSGFSAAVSNFAITNMAWLKAPDFASNLIDAQTIALAYSAMRLPQEDLDSFLQTAQSLSQNRSHSFNDLQLLRSSPHLQEELIRAKIKGDNLEAEETVSYVLAKVNAVHSAAADEAKSELRMEQEAHQKTQAELRRLQQKLEEDRAKRCDIIRRIGIGIISICLVVIVIGGIAHQFAPKDSWIANRTFLPSIMLSSIFGLSLVWGWMVITGLSHSILKYRFIKSLSLICNNKANRDA